MKRRAVAFLALLALTLLTPLTADAQASAQVSGIGILAAGPFMPERARNLKAFREHPRDLAWVERTEPHQGEDP